ncbi:MAG: peptidoglycan DD-metalloendopeptidase family protein, partial [Pseudomonadota bacterium]
SIAWRYGLDYKQLARWNKIDVNAPIYPGQRLRLIKPTAVAVSGASNPSKPAKTVEPVKSQSSSSQSTNVVTTTYIGSDPNNWRWPTKGKPLNTFVASRLDRRGIEISGKQGQAVVAVADGQVVYSGNGLVGYGNLIIIKHSDTYLSAYAYSQERLVQEGMKVKSGKIVAKMGSKDNTAKLYFEIRRNGKPVDPLKYLPKQ